MTLLENLIRIDQGLIVFTDLDGNFLTNQKQI